MNCKACGSPITENDQFCKNCGASVNVKGESSNNQNISSTVNNNSQNINGVVDNNSQNINGVVGNNSQNINGVVSNNSQNINGVVGNNSQNINNNPYQANISNVPNQMNNQANYNQPEMFNSKNSKGFVKYIIIGIAIVLIIAGVVFGITYFMNKDKSSNKVTSDDSSSQVTPVSDLSFYKVSLSGFALSIPENYVYQTKEESLLIGDEEDTWVSYLEIVQGSFSKLEGAMQQLPLSLQQYLGYTVSAAEKRTVKGVDFITFEADLSGMNAIIALAKVNSMYVACMVCMNINNDFDYSILEKMATIIDSAEYKGESTFGIQAPENFDMSIFSQYAQ